MKIWHTSSTESRKDILTKKKTSTYICFESCGFIVRVPTNDKDYNDLAKKDKAIKSKMKLIKSILVRP